MWRDHRQSKDAVQKSQRTLGYFLICQDEKNRFFFWSGLKIINISYLQRKKTCSSNLLICRNPSKRLTFEFLTWWTPQEFCDFTCPSHSLRGCLNMWGHGFHPLVGNIWLDTPRKTNMDMFVFSVKFCKNMLNSMIVQGNMRIIFPPTLWIWLWPNYLNSIHWNPSPFWGICSALFWKWIQRNCKKSVVCWKLFSFFGDVKEVFLGYFPDPKP